MKRSFMALQEQDSFESIKDVLESIRLKELRFNNINAALELGLEENREVRITYHSDERKNVKTDGIVWGFDGKMVRLNNFKKIPIRAIKKVEFYRVY
jgi:hypothetical protein